MSEVEFTAWVESLLWPLLVGGLGAFAFLVLLSSAHLRNTLLVEFCRDVSARRVKHEQAEKDREYHARAADRMLKFERELYRTAERHGLARAQTAPPPAKPAPAPTRTK